MKKSKCCLYYQYLKNSADAGRITFILNLVKAIKRLKLFKKRNVFEVNILPIELERKPLWVQEVLFLGEHDIYGHTREKANPIAF